MREDTVVQLRQPGTFSEDSLTEILRLGARRLLGQAVEMEVTAFVEGHADLTDEAGRRRIVRHRMRRLKPASSTFDNSSRNTFNHRSFNDCPRKWSGTDYNYSSAPFVSRGQTTMYVRHSWRRLVSSTDFELTLPLSAGRVMKQCAKPSR